MNFPTTRKILSRSNHGNIRVEEQSLQPPGAGEMLIRVHCSLISAGTELRVLQNPNLQSDEKWIVFGYQNAGVVADANGCEGFAEGDRVACLGAGYANHANWCVMPKNLVWKLSDALSFEEGAFANLLGTAQWAVRRAELQFGSHAAIVGLGVVGQLIAQMATLSGAHTIGIDRVAMRREMAERLGAEFTASFDPQNPDVWKKQYTRGYGIDAGFVAFGGDASQVVTNLAQVMKKAPDTHAYGKIVIVGGAALNLNFPTPLGNIDICSSSRNGPGYHDPVWERGGDYPQALVPWNSRRNLEECFRFMELKKLEVLPLITHRVGVNDAEAACRRLIQTPDEALAVIVRHE
jgi:threonine dehydrogenase-like Zn-dependent dehydrogenase